MKTQTELRAYAYGCISGILIVFATLLLVRYGFGVAWQPVQVGGLL